MKFNIETNKELDFEMIKVFMEGGSPLIQEFWPELKTPEDIPKYVEPEYGQRLQEKVKEMKAEIHRLEQIAEAISTVIGEKWEPVKIINIWIGACPIAPRFLDINSFLMPYYHPIPTQINTATHELIHFLYFKKWAKLFPEHKPENFESPDPVWVLSEILVAVIGNDPQIQKLRVGTFDVYPNWNDVKIGNTKLMTPFEKIYSESKTFDNFLKGSWIKFQDIDKKYKIVDKLTKNTF